jgi:uncharacterized protein (TIGR03083 family)
MEPRQLVSPGVGGAARGPAGLTQPPTTLAPATYLQLLRADAARLALVAEGTLAKPVPTCRGWRVRDVVLHTGEVYLHKVACMRLGRAPARQEYLPEAYDAEDNPVRWFRDALAVLLRELESRGPSAPSYTWWPPDQTVGFWYRRMAQETAVHRVDVESAVDAVGPVDDALALDGIDEVLRIMLANPVAQQAAEGDGHRDPARVTPAGLVAVRTGTHAWRVELGSGVPRVTPGHRSADATVTGEPSELLLWLWGRRPRSAVQATGMQSLVDELRERLAVATQ